MEVHLQRPIGHILVVHTIAFVAYIAVLQVGIEREFLLRTMNDSPVGFGINIRVRLLRIIAIILIINGHNQRIFQVIECTKVVTQIVVGCAA